MKHCVAIQINPQWDEQEFARVREWLLSGLFQRVNDPYDEIKRHTAFGRETDPVQGEVYVATYRPPERAVISWPVEVADVPR